MVLPEQTLTISEMVAWLVRLRDKMGDVPVILVDPLSGAPRPLSTQFIAARSGRVEIWPADSEVK